METLIKQLNQLSHKPEYGSEEYKNWIEQNDFLCFLQTIPTATDIILYASVSYYTFLFGVLVPEHLVTPPDIKDLDDWGCNPFALWGITISYGKRKKVSLSSPLSHTHSKVLDRGEQIVFAREFDGRQEQRSYIEISQKLAHVFDLHWVPEREAYCRFDKRGDVEEVVKVVTGSGQSAYEEGRVVTILRGVLDEYLVITKQALLLLFDSTRFDSKNFMGWQNQDVEHHKLNPEIYYHIGRNAETASYLRGFQIIRSAVSAKEVIKRYDFFKSIEQQYATFIALDWKHGIVHECSCDPKLLGNYFVESDLPYETSPVFFRPEVLQRYKADTEKYEVEDRSITCRHAWHLQTYDVNEEGQVHTYLIYLGQLPYEEQLYWKAFNEAPKGSISRRAFQTDFKGKWIDEYDPLQSLRRVLLELHESQVSWWVMRESSLPVKVHYPVTKAADEWAKEIHALDKLVVEGFVTDDLRSRATSLGRTIDSQWKSVKLIEEVLRGLGSEEEQVRKIAEPLRELNFLRSKISGHASGREADRIKAEVLKKYKTYPNHFRNLCTQCDRAIRILQTLLETVHI
jgi:hypothetical protein